MCESCVRCRSVSGSVLAFYQRHLYSRYIVTFYSCDKLVPGYEGGIDNGVNRAAFMREQRYVVVVIANGKNLRATGLGGDLGPQEKCDMAGVIGNVEVHPSFAAELMVRACDRDPRSRHCVQGLEIFQVGPLHLELTVIACRAETGTETAFLNPLCWTDTV